MFPFVVNEISDNPVDTFTEKFLIVQNAIDGLSDTAQPHCTFSMLSLKVSN